MKAIANQSWNVGDLFGIPLVDGTSLLGQIIAKEPSVLNSVSCALFDARIASGQGVTSPPDVNRVFAVLFATRDLLDSGSWKVVGKAKVCLDRSQFPYESKRSSGFVGAKVVGSRNVAEFANAFCGLVPWDDWSDPQYLDRLLISPDKKPSTLIYKK